MSMFTEAERTYLSRQRLGRLATSTAEGIVPDEGGATLGQGYSEQMFRITPRRVVSWGLDATA